MRGTAVKKLGAAFRSKRYKSNQTMIDTIPTGNSFEDAIVSDPYDKLQTSINSSPKPNSNFWDIKVNSKLMATPNFPKLNNLHHKKFAVTPAFNSNTKYEEIFV